MSPERRRPLLEIRNLASAYGHLQVLWDISLEVFEGELVSLVGPNGAGKTTTLRTISGLLKRKGGRVTFDSSDISGLPACKVSRMGISFVPEKLHLFTGMSVYENLLLGGHTTRNVRQVRETLEQVYELFPVLANRRKQLAGTLSGGEQRMLALGRGLVSSPRLLLVDEPSIGLAPKPALAVFETLLRLRKRGCTILLVEQNVHSSLEISDRTYVMAQGRIALTGNSHDLRQSEQVYNTYLGGGSKL